MHSQPRPDDTPPIITTTKTTTQAQTHLNISLGAAGAAWVSVLVDDVPVLLPVSVSTISVLAGTRLGDAFTPPVALETGLVDFTMVVVVVLVVFTLVVVGTVSSAVAVVLSGAAPSSVIGDDGGGASVVILLVLVTLVVISAVGGGGGGDESVATLLLVVVVVVSSAVDGSGESIAGRLLVGAGEGEGNERGVVVVVKFKASVRSVASIGSPATGIIHEDR